MFFVREGATHKLPVGPVVAVGDGFTPVTTLALSTADEAEVILHDNGTVVDISGYTWAAITTADGYYHLTLQAGITNTIGHTTVVINDDSLCLPVKAEYTVLPTEIYDALFASDADGFDASGRVNVGSVLGTAQTAGDLAALITTLDTVADAIKAKTDSLTFTVANQVDSNVLGIEGSDPTDQINAAADAAWTTQMADSVAADGVIATREQAVYMVLQFLTEFAISGTTLTVKKVDGSTTLMSFTLDDGTNPTSLTRS